MADTGGQRNEEPLTAEQKRQVEDYAVSLGMPIGRIQYSEVMFTCYGGMPLDLLVVGTDVVPLSKKSKRPNDNISLKGVIAHELVGHREASLKGRSQSAIELEEAQASIRAARFAPNLNNAERMILIRDAICRLTGKGLSLRPVKDKLFIQER